MMRDLQTFLASRLLHDNRANKGINRVRRGRRLTIRLFRYSDFILYRQILLMRRTRRFSIVRTTMFRGAIHERIIPTIGRSIQCAFIGKTKPLQPKTHVIRSVRLQTTLLMLLMSLQRFLGLRATTMTCVRLFARRNLHILHALRDGNRPIRCIRNIIMGKLANTNRNRCVTNTIGRTRTRFIFRYVSLTKSDKL